MPTISIVLTSRIPILVVSEEGDNWGIATSFIYTMYRVTRKNALLLLAYL